MEKIRPLILITNDDSVSAPGLMRLVECVPQGADIIVVAPDAPRSGQSSALTVDSPLRIKSHPDHGSTRIFSVTGTPVDCVKMAIDSIVPRRPDLILAGINHGSNAGVNVVYSGTMGAVIEGCIEGIPSCGFSLLNHSWAADFTPSMPFISEIISNVMTAGLPSGVCLNVNIPDGCTPKGVKVCRAARGRWTAGYERYVDPVGRPFFMLAGKFENQDTGATDTDEYWLDNEYISVVPVVCDMTAKEMIAPFAKVFDKDEQI